ncbi:MAG: hypothetical protein ACRD5D_00540 [Candidatus Polarisedimenticolia bacterium]
MAQFRLNRIRDDIASLRAFTKHRAKQTAFLWSTKTEYYFDPASTDADDGDEIIKPDDISGGSPGRWVKLGAVGGAGVGTTEFSWSLSGTLSTGQNANFAAIPASDDMTLVEIIGTVRTAPTGQDIEVDLKVDDITVGTLVIGVGETIGTVVIDVDILEGDILRIEVTQVGSVEPGETLYVGARSG